MDGSVQRGKRQKLISGDEVDAIYCRNYYNWSSKTLKKINRALNKRLRRKAKINLLKEI